MGKIIRAVAGVVGLLWVGIAWAGCDEMVAWGMPKVKQNGEPAVLCRQMYVLEHNDEKRTAWWSAERLLGHQQELDGTRINAFKADPDLPKTVAAKPSDYAGSKCDMGHLAPVGDMYTSPTAMIESFYLSNIIPQVPGNNRVGWRFLEGYVRHQAVTRGEVFVITGPIYQANSGVSVTCKISIPVPTHIFKIVYDPKTHEALSFVVPNIPVKWMDITHFVSDVATVEQLTGINFFPDSTTPIKNSYRMW